MGAKYTHNYQLNTFDFDQNYSVRLTSLMNFLQDISTRQFEYVMTRHSEIEAPGLWVIIEWDIEFHAEINHPISVALTTEPVYFRRFIGYRRYEMCSEDGTVLLTASSKWAYIDAATRKQLSIPERLYDCFEVDADAERPTWRNKFKLEGAWNSENLFKSHYSDVDVNRHVNNVTYVRWAMDAAFIDRPELSEHYFAEGVKVIFKKETFGESTVRVSSLYFEVGGKQKSLHRLSNLAGDICVEIEIKWAQKGHIKNQ